VAKRSRKKRGAGSAGGAAQKLKAPTSEYTDPDGNVLALRGSLTAATRAQYRQVMAGGERPAATPEDTWHRALEFLFERLAVHWQIAGVPISRQQELLARFRVASPDQRAWIHAVLREHCAENFPDVKAP
jgi:uncharacterized protein YcaQ